MEWTEIQNRVHKVISEVFIAYQVRYAEELQAEGDLHLQKGFYGVDILINDEF